MENKHIGKAIADIETGVILAAIDISTKPESIYTHLLKRKK